MSKEPLVCKLSRCPEPVRFPPAWSSSSQPLLHETRVFFVSFFFPPTSHALNALMSKSRHAMDTWGKKSGASLYPAISPLGVGAPGKIAAKRVMAARVRVADQHLLPHTTSQLLDNTHVPGHLTSHHPRDKNVRPTLFFLPVRTTSAAEGEWISFHLRDDLQNKI